MKKETIITAVLAASLGAVTILASGCAPRTTHSSAPIYPGADFSEQDLYILDKLYNMENKSDCLSCFGCVWMTGPANCCGKVDGEYYGCIDCFGVTAGENDQATDYFSTTKLMNGCYCVNIPLDDGDGGYVPTYGCMTVSD